MAFLRNNAPSDSLLQQVVRDSLNKHLEYQGIATKLSPAELNDVSMQRFRVYAIGAMVRAVTKAFLKEEAALVTGEMTKPLIESSEAEGIRRTLKDFSLQHAYRHRSVLEVELQGFNVIRELMDLIWSSIVDRKEPERPSSMRRQPFTRYVYGRISENYRRVFENPSAADQKLPLRYRECLLLTDMISGMTDSFAVDFFHELDRLRGRFDPGPFLSAAAK